MRGREKPTGTILIVEDSRTQAEYLGHILEKEGLSYIIAENGRVALEMIAREKPEIILTDIVMSEMDGYDLCRSIRQDPETRNIPVVMVTQLFDAADLLKGLEAGANNFIIKPFDPVAVFTRIAEVLHEEKTHDTEWTEKPLTVTFFKKTYAIRAGRLRILQILISTYDLAIRKNSELQDAQEHLQALNEQLQQTVEDLQAANEGLTKENSARKQVEADLAQANRKLQLMTSITRHDLLNHLTVLQGYLELTRMKGTDAEKMADYLMKSLAVVEKSINTIQFTSEYQNIGVAAPAWHNVSALISRSRKYASPGEVNVVNEIPDHVEIYADPLVEKVIYNLVDNALRYGSTLTTIRFRLSLEGGDPVILCEDDGVGIQDDQKERVFAYGVGKNTGMGLFLVREILAITGISIRETGIFGKGARFEIIIPRTSYRSNPIKPGER